MDVFLLKTFAKVVHNFDGIGNGFLQLFAPFFVPLSFPMTHSSLSRQLPSEQEEASDWEPFLISSTCISPSFHFSLIRYLDLLKESWFGINFLPHRKKQHPQTSFLIMNVFPFFYLSNMTATSAPSHSGRNDISNLISNPHIFPCFWSFYLGYDSDISFLPHRKKRQP